MDGSVVVQTSAVAPARPAGRSCPCAPTWFGIPESSDGYVRSADAHPGVLADVGDGVVGITTVKQSTARTQPRCT